ncbi:MAG TPA: threonine--tRNA ligase [Acidimicrobiaceae bacterium]|nr:threonine--tRNA ligase [Acidimicrobiaceae bacterium]
MPEQIAVTLPDGSSRELPTGSTAGDLARSIARGLAKKAVIAEVNDVERDLSHELVDGDRVAIVTADSDQGLYVIRHSTAHVLAQAVLELFPGATFGIGPPVENGFYYDFELPDGGTFHEEDLERIEARMREILKESQPFVKSEIGADEARTIFADHKYKLEIIENASTDPMSATSDRGEVRCYENIPPEPRPNQTFHGHDGFIDLCRGPHVPTTSDHLGHFKLMRVAGAYWRGDEKNPQLQRIYGTAWATKQELADHLQHLEEAAKRDHRRLGTELDLFSFPSEIGGGLAVWHPKGGIVRKLMEDYSRARHEEGGYEFVYTPHLTKAGVFETSGHLHWYADGMYPPMEMDNGTYYMKPMNCPMHCLVYRGRQRSYRELPLRLYELGTVYRYERAGTLHGLMRIRGFTQDDSHIYVAEEQLADEIAGLLDFVLSVLRAFGFEDFTFNLSTKDPDKYVGSDEIWEKATEALREALDRHGLEYGVKEGDAAFYGPKIDIDVRDAIGRSWQLSTIQADFNHPEKFDLTYVGADNEHHRPIMLHRALFGSIERFFGVLLEHYAGAFPTWLAPVQAVVCPVADEHEDHAQTVADRLRDAGVRVEVSAADDGLGARIRRHKMEKVPHILVVGGDDVANDTVADNVRGGDKPERDIPVADLIERITAEIRDHA